MKRLFTLGFALAAAAGLSACMPQQSQWAGNETAMRNTVDLVRVAHDVAFEDEEKAVSDTQATRLAAFLRETGLDYGDRLFVDIPEDRDGRANPIDQDRAKAVIAHLGRLGYDVYAKPLPYGAVPPENTVRIVVERYVVTPPKCPDWRQPAYPNFENAPSSNWGCANVTALGLMVANPRDLVEGREYRPTDGGNAAAAVRRYREDKIKWGKKGGGEDISEGLIEEN
ncbi:MAG: hypothetical protein D6763_02640 [Alphaproteobacteria bacterium]|nr:MAG: hypothetical protein D6763_02640 [Alphaproteobacteria bacterium]